ncbi:23S rRNA (pseudouridine(1915)-N(3))-methyltransferase RlmH [Pararhizobium mangrovi]|uniref:Ribosomal RNA large subunit methyltransferase H n=1 Tax=Pararhizobium mangrovi TaxID=2590452 RepID=A0A506U0N7_9HYPH|nr:23S rRNA (pseudouridine(1915)-N(3))-methyltransferase RlmH [Pararhizobium mangrovi]TPW26525.1 23S rRNA (pseudouridine(1915)-N(3))-methyltransferase RlmH [Pararhizobium mangrovi]
MRVRILAVGRLKAGPERELVARYADRLAKIGRGLGLEPDTTVEIPESRAGDAATRRREEGAALSRALPERTVLFALDERGKPLDSQALAAHIGDFRDAGRASLSLLIGGADGLDPALSERADVTIALGRMTWPHQLVRVMLCEQLYRAATILAGHPYHRAG